MSYFPSELIKEILSRYPVKRSAVMPLLHLAQEREGHITHEAVEHIASLLQMCIIQVYEIVHFYSMYSTKPRGKALIEVCTTTPCWLRGADQLVQTCERLLSTKVEHTNYENSTTLLEVECLGACTIAPVMQINGILYGNLDNHIKIEKTLKNVLKAIKNDENA